MPRLSIIVPFQHDEAALETTLLSLLENRPRDVEVLLAHNGSYHDPYGLGADELIVVETQRDISLVGLINEGLSATGSPIVHILLPGMEVGRGWVEPAVSAFQEQHVSAAMPVVREIDSLDTCFYGLDAAALPRRMLINHFSSNHPQPAVTPLLAGGFFRRRTMLGLGGWLDCGSRVAAEVDLGLAFRSLELDCAVLPDHLLLAPSGTCESHEGNYAIGQTTGQLALAYSEVPDSGVVIDSIVTRLGHLASGLMNPRTVAERLGWVLGVRDRSLVSRIANRIEGARQSLGASTTSSKRTKVRRAA